MAMKELGFRKVVYSEGNEIKVLRGNCSIENDFIVVRTDYGEVLVSRNAIIAIKDGGGFHG